MRTKVLRFLVRALLVWFIVFVFFGVSLFFLVIFNLFF